MKTTSAAAIIAAVAVAAMTAYASLDRAAVSGGEADLVSAGFVRAGGTTS